jgi:hypothetical protein
MRSHAVPLSREGADQDGLLAGLEASAGRAVQHAAEGRCNRAKRITIKESA